MDKSIQLNRRGFLKASTIGAGGMVLSINMMGCAAPGMKNNGLNKTETQWDANAWLRIDTDNSVHFVLDRTEMGQGIYTGMTTLLADELEVNPELIQVSFAGVDSVYQNPLYKLQMTGASTSTSTSWDRIRIAGATAREMLKKSAAETWNTNIQQLKCSEGQVIHPDGRTLSYGDLVTIAAHQKVPDVELKKEKDFTYIGKFNKRLDVNQKTDGSPIYGIDQELPGMVYAVVSRPKAFGGSVKSFNAEKAKQAAGVLNVLEIHSGVAVVAKTYWQARKALQLLEIEWQAPEEPRSSQDIMAFYEKALKEEDGKQVREEGDFDDALEASDNTLEATYSFPYLAHATLEPQNCLVSATEDGMEVYAPTQFPDAARVAASRYTDYSLDDIKIHVTQMGGGFGRRLFNDFVAECAEISGKLMQPVKLIWSREEDTQHDFYRPASLHKMKASLDEQNKVTGWQHRLAHPKVFHWIVADAAPAQMPFVPKFLHSTMPASGKLLEGIAAPVDTSGFEGAEDLHYDIENIDVRFVHAEPNVPVGYWRSVGFSHNGFAVESFVDELAHQQGMDPLEYRLEKLKDHPRALKVLQTAASLGSWGAPTPGYSQGVAIIKSFHSWVAQIAEVKVENGVLDIKSISCVVDCGTVVNPDIVQAQMEGGIIFGLTAALYGEITLNEQGEVQQTNFHDNRLMRMNEVPDIRVEIMQNKEDPTGVGEPGVPPVAPAIANAIFKQTGKRLRQLPLKLS